MICLQSYTKSQKTQTLSHEGGWNTSKPWMSLRRRQQVPISLNNSLYSWPFTTQAKSVCLTKYDAGSRMGATVNDTTASSMYSLIVGTYCLIRQSASVIIVLSSCSHYKWIATIHCWTKNIESGRRVGNSLFLLGAFWRHGFVQQKPLFQVGSLKCKWHKTISLLAQSRIRLCSTHPT